MRGTRLRRLPQSARDLLGPPDKDVQGELARERAVDLDLLLHVARLVVVHDHKQIDIAVRRGRARRLGTEQKDTLRLEAVYQSLDILIDCSAVQHACVPQIGSILPHAPERGNP